MADEEDPWGFDEADSEPAAAAPAPAAAAAADAGAAPAAGGGESAPAGGETAAAAEEESAPPPPPPEDDGYRKPVQLYRHWVRPQFLQYKYMYNYRTNYYDDVIDYLDKKQVGVSREIPRAQTWAERVLRKSNVSGRDLDSYSCSSKRDKHLVQTLAASIRTHNYHTKAYINQKYANVL
ncbi:flightin [Zeugodacus cucurbitae]|uniref:Flightin n=1 Tax=Zeugodacus cucurbitae TaxID=28588 RepID=A0A0A1XER2_ZEUCU|nr:flightin [Zeugodacus cucurbitae]XP_011189822.1 flightin [Zeugodacus cucurbitae]XP_054086024.1 flightin [Zeugodacus cucurbitae]